MEDIYSSSKKSKVFPIIANVLFLISLALLAWCTFLVFSIKIFPFKYLLAILLLTFVIIILNICLLGSQRPKIKKITYKLSVVLSCIVIVFSSVFSVYMGTLQTSLQKIPNSNAEVDASSVSIGKEPFFVYLSGIDTRGSTEIKEKGLSDVNMVIAINPLNSKILMINTPRDFYVPLYGDQNKMDKLTHAGNRGVTCSMETLEALYGIKFNYYVKVNFKSVVDIVDALGGITVESEIAFKSKYALTKDVTYTFVKGKNELHGLSALAFARERKSIPGGDRQRGKNQQIVIKGMMDKALSPSIITSPSKISEVVTAVTSNTSTNISYNEISQFIKFQLDKMPSWQVNSISVDGTGAYKTTYSTGSAKAYVMIPKQETVDAAKLAIDDLLSNNEATSSNPSSN